MKIPCSASYLQLSEKRIILMGKGKGHEGTDGEYKCSSTLSLTSALHGGKWLRPRPDSFTPGKETRSPFYRRLSGPQRRSGRVRKTSPPPGFDPRTIQPVASRYADSAITGPHILMDFI
jgi:hypothetical protein